MLQRDMFYAFKDFAKELTVACNYSEKLTNIPLQVREYNYADVADVHSFLLNL